MKEVREIIKKKGVSFYRVSQDLGVAQESLYRSLKNDSNPRWKTIKKVLDYLDYDIVLIPKRREAKPRKSKLSRSRQ